MYATNFDLGHRRPSSVSQYDVGAGGALTPKTPATVPSGNGPDGIAASPDGRSVYVANFREDLQGRPGAVSQYDVGAGGRLAPKTPAKVVTLGFMRHVAVAPDGRSVYVTDTNNGVHQFDVGAGGTLAPKSPSSVAAGTTPVGLAISPDGRSVYVANTGSDDVSQLDVDASGALSPRRRRGCRPATTPPAWRRRPRPRARERRTTARTVAGDASASATKASAWPSSTAGRSPERHEASQPTCGPESCARSVAISVTARPTYAAREVSMSRSRSSM